MSRPVTLCTLQWGDLSLEEVCIKAKKFGYDGLELGLPAHLDVTQTDIGYYQRILELLERYDLKVYAISAHLVSQAICDRIDERHKAILPQEVWGNGEEEGVKERASDYLIKAAKAASLLGVDTVLGFTGSSIWPLLYSFPPVTNDMIDAGFTDFSKRFIPILDEFRKLEVRFALEVHPTEIAFDIATAERALSAIDYDSVFGFNFDPSHLGYQGVDYIKFIRRFHNRIFHVHMKDVYWSDTPTEAGVFGGFLPFGDYRRFWNFRSLGRGNINFEEIIRALNDIGYQGPLSVEWEDSGMDREYGAKESCEFVKMLDFAPSIQAFDAAFERKRES